MSITEAQERLKLARDKAEGIADDLQRLANKPHLTRGEQTRFDDLTRAGDKAAAEAREAHEEWENAIRRGIASGEVELESGDGGRNIAEARAALDRDPARHRGDVYRPYRGNPWEGMTQTGPIGHLHSPAELRSRAYTAIEKASGTTDRLRERLTEIVERFDNPRGDLARQVVLSTNPDYVSGFFRLIQGDQILTEPEAHAVRAVRDLQRAMSLTDAAGGYLVPAQLDPSLIITGEGSQSDLRQIARSVIATGDTWTGVSAAQITASWDAEAEQVSDDSPTLAQPSVPIHMSRVFVPYSIEVGMDGANFTQEIVRLMADAQANLEAVTLATGTGSGEPTGIVTALTGTASETASGSTDAFAISDVYAVYDAVPARYKDRASWLANDLVYTSVRAFGTADSHAFWTHLDGPTPARLIGRPTHSSSAMDGTINAGTENYLLILGDFSNYVVANRIGFTIEPIQHLFSTANNRPTGQRGLFGYARLGADSVNDGAFIMLNVT